MFGIVVAQLRDQSGVHFRLFQGLVVCLRWLAPLMYGYTADGFFSYKYHIATYMYSYKIASILFKHWLIAAVHMPLPSVRSIHLCHVLMK